MGIFSLSLLEKVKGTRTPLLLFSTYIFYFTMARMLAIILFLAVGALARPQSNGEPVKPEPKELEAPPATLDSEQPKIPDESAQNVVKTMVVPEGKATKPVEEIPVKVAELPVEKPDPKPEEKPEPEKEEPETPKPEAEPKSEIKPAPITTERTCVDECRNCLKGAIWSNYTMIANCTWKAGVCLAKVLAGRLGIQY